MSTVLGPPVMMSDNGMVNIIIGVSLVLGVLFVFGTHPLIKMIADRNRARKSHQRTKRTKGE